MENTVRVTNNGTKITTQVDEAGIVETTIRDSINFSDGHYTIRQTSATSESVMRSGLFSSKEEAEADLSEQERAMLGGLVNIVYVMDKTVTVKTTTETIV